MTLGYLVHAFDLLNVGDLDLIGQARQRCSHLVLGVLTDEVVEQLYGRPPVVPLPDRLALVARVRGVDEVRAHPAEVGGVPDRATVFVATGEPRPPQLPAAVPLSRRRETTSAVVRAVLAPRVPLATSTGAAAGQGGAA